MRKCKQTSLFRTMFPVVLLIKTIWFKYLLIWYNFKAKRYPKEFCKSDVCLGWVVSDCVNELLPWVSQLFNFLIVNTTGNWNPYTKWLLILSWIFLFKMYRILKCKYIYVKTGYGVQSNFPILESKSKCKNYPRENDEINSTLRDHKNHI